MTKSRRPTEPKWDESDFDFQVEEMDSPDSPNLIVDAGRVYKEKPTTRRIGTTQTVRVCIHGRLEFDLYKNRIRCATCEYEAPLLLERQRRESGDSGVA